MTLVDWATLIDALLPNAQPAITWFNAESLNRRSHTGTGLSTVENSCKVSVAAALPAKATANRARKLSERDLWEAITRPADAVIAQTKTLRTAPSLLLDKFPHCTTIVQKQPNMIR